MNNRELFHYKIKKGNIFNDPTIIEYLNKFIERTKKKNKSIHNQQYEKAAMHRYEEKIIISIIVDRYFEVNDIEKINIKLDYKHRVYRDFLYKMILVHLDIDAPPFLVSGVFSEDLITDMKTSLRNLNIESILKE